MAAMTLCEHIRPGPCPWQHVVVIDAHLGPTDSLVRCRICGAHYLLEMLDWQGAQRLFRLRAPDAASVALFTRDLERGSCDLNRAGEEARQFSLAAERLPLLVLFDTRADRVLDVIRLDRPEAVPGTGWRELPCDGSWISRLAG